MAAQDAAFPGIFQPVRPIISTCSGFSKRRPIFRPVGSSDTQGLQRWGLPAAFPVPAFGTFIFRATSAVRSGQSTFGQKVTAPSNSAWGHVSSGKAVICPMACTVLGKEVVCTAHLLAQLNGTGELHAAATGNADAVPAAFSPEHGSFIALACSASRRNYAWTCCSPLRFYKKRGINFHVRQKSDAMP